MKSLKMLSICLFLVLGLVTGMQVVSHADDAKTDDARAPVAISGYCPVCVLQGMLNKGSDNFTTEYKGKLYKFEGMDEQKEFLENPELYTKDLEEKFKKLQQSSAPSGMAGMKM